MYPDWTPTLGGGHGGRGVRVLRRVPRALIARFWSFSPPTSISSTRSSPRSTAWTAPSEGGRGSRTSTTGARASSGSGRSLSMSSYEYRTAPTLRGRWILINLMCTPPQDPPGGIPPLDSDPAASDASEGNVRERLEKHREDPTCARCHAALDPYGIALENFDGIGKFRTEYKNGAPVDASTVTLAGDLVHRARRARRGAHAEAGVHDVHREQGLHLRARSRHRELRRAGADGDSRALDRRDSDPRRVARRHRPIRQLPLPPPAHAVRNPR